MPDLTLVERMELLAQLARAALVLWVMFWAGLLALRLLAGWQYWQQRRPRDSSR